MAIFCHYFPAQNLAFMVFKMTRWISWFQRKNRFEKRCILTRDIGYIQNCFFHFVSQTQPNRQPKTDFNQYLGHYWVLLQTDFCIETVSLCRSF